MRYRFNIAGAILAGIAVLGMVCPVCATITARKDSANFANKAEFDAAPAPGWALYDTYTIADGVVRLGDSVHAMGAFYVINSNQWFRNYSEGWTYEASVKVVTADTPRGNPYVPDMGFGLLSMKPGAEPRPYSFFWIGDTYVQYGDPNIYDNLIYVTTGDNRDDYHIFRVAKEPASQNYSIWRDGELLIELNGAACDRIVTGSSWGVLVAAIAGEATGESYMDYYRSTPGAWAPATAPVPSSMALLISAIAGLAAHAWRGRR